MTDDRDIEPENGKRAYLDPKTGEVHGSGAGAGGGNPGEDLDDGPGGDASLQPLPGEGRTTHHPIDAEGKTNTKDESDLYF